MNRIPKSKRDLWIMGCFLFLSVFVWMGNKAIHKTSDESLLSIGGSLSSSAQRILRRMNKDIENAQYLLTAEPDRITFLSENEGAKEYSFAYQTLWRNEFPMMGRVRTFHFEYRDARGNLIGRPSENLTSVEVVGYTLCLEKGDQEIFVNYRLNIPAVRTPPSYDEINIEVAQIFHKKKHTQFTSSQP